MSGLILVAGPSTEPISLAEAKAHLRVDDTTEDGLIAGYIMAARQHCEGFTNRALLTQTFDKKIDYCWPRTLSRRDYPSYRIDIERAPFIAVTSITYVDMTGATQTLASNQYQVSLGDIRGCIVPAYGVTWPTTRRQVDAITVRFTAGYGTNPGDIPEPIRQAMLLLIGHWFGSREAVVAEARVTPIELPLGVQTLLSKYVTEGWA